MKKHLAHLRGSVLVTAWSTNSKAGAERKVVAGVEGYGEDPPPPAFVTSITATELIVSRFRGVSQADLAVQGATGAGFADENRRRALARGCSCCGEIDLSGHRIICPFCTLRNNGEPGFGYHRGDVEAPFSVWNTDE